MKIRNIPCEVFDVEVFKNIFHVVIYNTEIEETIKFEISPRVNQVKELSEYFSSKEAYFVGYNSIHYDNCIVNYIIKHFNNDDYKWYQITESLFQLSQSIINDKDFEKIKPYKYANTFRTLDLLTMLYSKQLRVSLKEIQVTMMYWNVQEFLTDWNKPLELHDFDKMIDYNINDVMSTTELLSRCMKDVMLRVSIEDEYEIECLNKDGVNIGMEILKQKYLEKTGLTWWDIKDLRSPADYIDLKEVILPIVQYNHPILKNMLDLMKKSKVSPDRKGFEHKFIYGGLQYSVGVGGIHSINKPEIVIPEDNEMLIDIDVTSLYPSMIEQYGFYPQHLGIEFVEVYSQIKVERIEAKRTGNMVKNETLKLALNGLSGNLQNAFSWCYSPFAVMQIRINGQLLLLMLAEALYEATGCKIVQANTDGLFILLKKSQYDKLRQVCQEWEQLTKLQLEEERFSSMYQFAINDYFAITESGKVKEKGMFITDVRLGKGLSPKIIPKAVIAYFKDGIPAETTIKSCTDIKDFLMSEKTGKTWKKVTWGLEEVQRTNRFFVSYNGKMLWKHNENGPHNIISRPVTLLNVFDNKSIKERDIDYGYYLNETLKIIEELQPRQLSLW